MEKTKRVHEGRNIKRFREMLGIKQETLAFQLGEAWTQKKISQLEAKEWIERDILEQVAAILNVSPEVIQRFDEEAAINIISSTLHDNAGSVFYNFSPIDKLVEAYEENRKLYERLLESEREKLEMLKSNKR
ncbi:MULTISPECIES: helix-turn-helix domain-containing protein [Sphingobacterium]|uniref:helix-turn-helix domain-containing protein n=1 Tax=Sphingobacterium TaxID=28453 RepID=UPI0028AE537E|nr:helix-turn-helix transcriptional regulator [Sphingobacterium multivorum]